MRWQRWIIVAVIPLLMLASMALILQQSRKRQEAKQIAKQLGPSDMSPPVQTQKERILGRQLDVPGISNPEFVDPENVELAPSDQVIGLVVAGKPRAYLRRALAGRAKKHIVSDSTEEGQITVTHCDLSECTRVFLERGAREPKEIRVGGLQADGTIELLIEGRRYPQREGKIPLAEFPFAETTWGDWLAKYPDSKIYVGDQAGA